MANLQLTYKEVYDKVGEFVGWVTPGTALSDATQLALAKAVVDRGYLKFLHPIDMRIGKGHTWSFLTKFGKLMTQSGQWIYNLPVDYDKLLMGFIHESDSGYPPMSHVSPEIIYQLRVGGASTSYPQYYAIRAGSYVKEIGTSYEVLFYEIPNSGYELNYSYAIRPPQLSATTDVFVGSDFASDVILECCLAAAEQEYDDVIGIHSQKAEELIQQLIQTDSPIMADSVGKNLDTGTRTIQYERPLPTTLTANIYA